MRQIAIISGKGGTGKTSTTLALATLFDDLTLADCDVDAANMHLVVAPGMCRSEDYTGSAKAVVNKGKCVSCGKCVEICPFEAITKDFTVDAVFCEGCGLCTHFCPTDAIAMKDVVTGKMYTCRTRFGPFIYAKLAVGVGNSGKLVSRVREKASDVAKNEGNAIILIDGPPGVGCPVIASITGTDAMLIVTEPTLSGLFATERVMELAKHFSIPSLVCINKSDINPEVNEIIKMKCNEQGVAVVGEIPYDENVTKAMMAGKSIVEYAPNSAVTQRYEDVAKEVLKHVKGE